MAGSAQEEEDGVLLRGMRGDEGELGVVRRQDQVRQVQPKGGVT